MRGRLRCGWFAFGILVGLLVATACAPTPVPPPAASATPARPTRTPPPQHDGPVGRRPLLAGRRAGGDSAASGTGGGHPGGLRPLPHAPGTGHAGTAGGGDPRAGRRGPRSTRP